jgi:hypothetical protein
MKIEYICHACLSIDTADLRIATDPWFHGPAYCGQWNVFPKPVNTKALDGSQVILLSHGHEDHFHVPTLQLLPRTARVLYPYSWYGGIKPYLRELGFDYVDEAVTHRTIQLSLDTSVTYIVNNLDSIMVIESAGKVFVNVNDALHSYPPKIVDSFVEYIRQRWPSIDTVFSGFGGASYFPNTIHCPEKNDLEIAAAREQMFVHAFCRIVHGLNPRVAVPFAADFALLNANQRWINEARFPRSRVPHYYREAFGESPASTQILEMYPGDVLVDNVLSPRSPYRAHLRHGSLNHLVSEQYREEIAALDQKTVVNAEEAHTLEQELRRNIARRAQNYDPGVLKKLEFSVRVPDLAEDQYFNVQMRDGIPGIERSSGRSRRTILEITIPSKILRYSMASEWGGDAVTIGYGCEIQVFDEAAIQQSLDVICVQLLTRIPSASKHWRNEPLRMARYVLSSPFNRRWAAHSALIRLQGKASSNENNDKLRAWLFRTKCEVCRACDLPMLDEKFAQSLN